MIKGEKDQVLLLNPQLQMMRTMQQAVEGISREGGIVNRSNYVAIYTIQYTHSQHSGLNLLSGRGPGDLQGQTPEIYSHIFLC